MSSYGLSSLGFVFTLLISCTTSIPLMTRPNKVRLLSSHGCCDKKKSKWINFWSISGASYLEGKVIKPRLSQQPIRTGKRLKARENEGYHVALDFCVASDWLVGRWGEFSRPIRRPKKATMRRGPYLIGWEISRLRASPPHTRSCNAYPSSSQPQLSKFFFKFVMVVLVSNSNTPLW